MDRTQQCVNIPAFTYLVRMILAHSPHILHSTRRPAPRSLASVWGKAFRLVGANRLAANDTVFPDRPQATLGRRFITICNQRMRTRDVQKRTTMLAYRPNRPYTTRRPTPAPNSAKLAIKMTLHDSLKSLITVWLVCQGWHLSISLTI